MPDVLLDLFVQFANISLLAFGGGPVVLALIERIAVADRAWITPAQFGAAVGFGYVTPGPVLVLAAFVGYFAAGFEGAVVASIGVFILPWALAMGAARGLRSYLEHRRVRGFGRAAGPAVIGLLGVTVISLARSGLTTWAHVGIGALAVILMTRTQVHPIAILATGAVLGIVVDLPLIASIVPGLQLP